MSAFWCAARLVRSVSTLDVGRPPPWRGRYGKGGTKPTTTDANLVLGRIDANSFVGGEVEPDWNAVDQAFVARARGTHR